MPPMSIVISNADLLVEPLTAVSPATGDFAVNLIFFGFASAATLLSGQG